ncbi:hypothetical protein [Pseudomonas putida]|uniref:hypothetical protein n=1 Tax=Pseudomonas putida TaxID=303 RepID=UPI0035714209
MSRRFPGAPQAGRIRGNPLEEEQMRPVMTLKAVRDSLGRLMDEKEDAGEGKFHCWGVEYEEFENGPGNYSVAIVEMADGTIQTLMPWAIRFLDGEDAKQQALNDFLARPAIG